MTKLQALIGVIGISSMLWVGGYLRQKALPNDHKVYVNSKFVILLGIRPGSQPVYIRPAIVQIVAMLSVPLGAIAIWYSKSSSIVQDVIIIGLVIMGVTIGAVDIWYNIRKKQSP